MALLYPALDNAIGAAEGYGTPGAIPTLANNPGDLVAGPFATAHGATGSITAANGQQIATFADPATGLSATDALVANNYAGGDINALSSSWLAGSPAAQQASWAANVSQALGVPASTPVSSLAGVTTAAGTPAPSTALGTVASTIAAGIAATVLPAGISWTRAAAFIVGLICIGVGLMLFKPAQDIIVQPILRAGKGAASAAAVGAAGL